MTSFLARGRASFLALLLIALLGSARTASAEDSKKAQCASAYEKSQELRAAGSLKAAHDMLVVCAQDFCPAFVQSDCAQWLTEVSRDLPTIVIVAKDKAGEDTAAVAVTMDGNELMKQLDGKAVSVDPGPHSFKFELEGADAVEQQIVIRQGQKDRVVAVSFAPASSESPGESPYAGGAKPGDMADTGDVKKGPGPLRPYAYVAGGVGAASLITFAVLGGVAKGQESDLRGSGCAPNCSRSTTDSIKTKYIVADVFLGVGIAGIGTGVALFFLSQPKNAPEPQAAGKLHFDVGAAPGMAYATLDGKF
ncbi:MAG TPA: hypothetical protein VHU80_24240 [Polyangiaceae bacterium]|jgi:hypothetical protein|nr:hypothetical protein [Polyangiaceae bacterium]